MAVSPAFWQVVDLALQAERETDGLVTPLLLDALEAAGYDRSFDALDRSGPQTKAAAEARPAPRAADAVRRDSRQRTLQLMGGARLDLGGVAKGWAATGPRAGWPRMARRWWTPAATSPSAGPGPIACPGRLASPTPSGRTKTLKRYA